MDLPGTKSFLAPEELPLKAHQLELWSRRNCCRLRMTMRQCQESLQLLEQTSPYCCSIHRRWRNPSLAGNALPGHGGSQVRWRPRTLAVGHVPRPAASAPLSFLSCAGAFSRLQGLPALWQPSARPSVHLAWPVRASALPGFSLSLLLTLLLCLLG